MAVLREKITQKRAKNNLVGSTKYKQPFSAKCSALCGERSVKGYGVQVYPFGRGRIRKTLGRAKVK